MKIILVLLCIVSIVFGLYTKQSEQLCSSSKLASRIQCDASKDEYLKIVEGRLGSIQDDQTCPITTYDDMDISDLLKKNCDYQLSCGIVKQFYYDSLDFDFPLESSEVVVTYTCEKEANVAKALWNAFNSQRAIYNLYPVEWNEAYAQTAMNELKTRYTIQGGYSDSTVFHTHGRLDGVAAGVKKDTNDKLKYMMEFVAKLSTSIQPAMTAITEWVESRKEEDQKNMLYEYDQGGVACDKYSTGWVCVLHAVKL